MQSSQATANPVGGKACSSTKCGLLRYILNTYSILKVSSLKFHITSTQYAANTLHQRIFKGRLSRHITSPSGKTRPESWPEDYMGKSTPFWQLSSPNVTCSRAKPQQTPSVEKHAGLLSYILNTYSIHKVSSLKFAYYKHSICR